MRQVVENSWRERAMAKAFRDTLTFVVLIQILLTITEPPVSTMVTVQIIVVFGIVDWLVRQPLIERKER